jgi:hypothetical protein
MSDPVRDTRQAVDAARHALLEWGYDYQPGYMPVSDADYNSTGDKLIDSFAAAVEAWVLARERRETFARGDDATEARP